MSESGRNIFLHHNGIIEDDIYHPSKKIHPGTNAMASNNYFLVAKSQYPNLELNFNLA